MSIIHGLEIEKFEEYDNHHKVVSLNNPNAGLKGCIAIHRKNKDAPSFGATRIWEYEDSLEGLRDALRLSRLMSYKAALAGLPCGGAKGVIFMPKELRDRKNLLLSYAKEVNLLNGDFITGTDVGLSQDDLKLMKTVSNFFVGMNGDAAQSTALGIYYGIEASLEFLTTQGKIFAIQGLGKIGESLLSLLYLKADKIYVSDIDKSLCQKIKRKFPNIVVVKPSEIHKQEVDVFAPCALGAVINSKTVSELNCKIVAGGANGQLENEDTGTVLYKLGILYSPDYVINAGGLISVFDEYEGIVNKDNQALEKKIFKIKDRLLEIYKTSQEEKTPTNIVANKIAEKVFNSYK